MPDATGTIYTSQTDTWDSLLKGSGLSKKELIAINPHLTEVQEIEPGIPVDVPYAGRRKLLLAALPATAGATSRPYDFAKAELLKHVAQLPGENNNNARIVLYHSTTQGGAAPDEVAWCSSFVNYCVEQAGLVGTDSKAARSWHTSNWGVAVPKSEWREGDIIVFWRVAKTHWKGHVGFLVGWSGSRPEVLGGNQGDRLSIATPYPYSQILSVRRPA